MLPSFTNKSTNNTSSEIYNGPDCWKGNATFHVGISDDVDDIDEVIDSVNDHTFPLLSWDCWKH
jgi:hypothetical protein